MNSEHPLRFAVASCWHEAFHEGTPSVPLGAFDLEDLRRRSAPAQDVALWPLTDRCGSLHLQWAALWVVLELDDGRAIRSPDGRMRVEFASARVLQCGRPHEVCRWLLTAGLPVPADDSRDVITGRNAERVESQLGGVLVAGRGGTAVAGFHGVACVFVGEAETGSMGVAINTASGTARAADKGVAVTTGWSDAFAGTSGIAIAVDEFQQATAGDGGTALAGFGGRANVGRNGIAVALSGTVMGAEGALLVVREGEAIHIARVGEGGIRPGTPYHVRAGRFVEGEWEMEL